MLKSIKAFLVQFKKLEPLSDTMKGGKSNRQFHRHYLRSFSGFEIIIEGISYPMINISYGGSCIESQDRFFSISYIDKKSVAARLSVLGAEVECDFNICYVQGNLIGISFIQSDELRKFLDSFIYLLDAGYRMKVLSKSQVISFFHNPSWSSYVSHEGVFEAHVNTSMDGTLTHVYICQISGVFREFAAFSKSGVDVSTIPKKSLSLSEKSRVLRNSVFVILGFRQIGRTNIFDKLIRSAIHLVQKTAVTDI